MSDRQTQIFMGPKRADDEWGSYGDVGTVLSYYDGALSALTGEKKHGISKNGKSWSKWNFSTMYYFSIRSGDMRIYQKIAKHTGVRGQRKVIQMRDVTAGAFGAPRYYPRAGEAFDQIINTMLVQVGRPMVPGAANARTLQSSLFPALGLNEDWSPTYGIYPALQQTDGRSMVAASLGKSRVRKDVVKALASSRDLSGLAIASALKTIAPVDWLLPVLGARGAVHVGKANELKLALSRVGERQRRLLIANLVAPDIYAWEVRDTVNMLHNLAEVPRGDTWRALHHAVVPQHQLTERRRDDQEIPQVGVTKKLDGIEAGKMKLVSAKKSSDLWAWGREMSHCIGSYDRQAVAGTSHLFGLFEEGKMIANLELSPSGHVRQFYGRFNASPTETVRHTVGNAIKRNMKGY